MKLEIGKDRGFTSNFGELEQISKTTKFLFLSYFEGKKEFITIT